MNVGEAVRDIFEANTEVRQLCYLRLVLPLKFLFYWGILTTNQRRM